MAPQITSLTIVYSTYYSGIDQRKHQSSASLTFVRGIHRWPVNSPHKGSLKRKCFYLEMSSFCHVLWTTLRVVLQLIELYAIVIAIVILIIVIILFEYITIGLLYVFAFSVRIFYRGVQALELIFLAVFGAALYVSQLFGNLVLNNKWSVKLA